MSDRPKLVKMVRTKKATHCTNCGRNGHTNKQCSDPVTSYGIITIRVNMNPLPNMDSLHIDNDDNYPIPKISLADRDKFALIEHSVDFLMIRRKHTLGYMEFVRGHYRPDGYDGLISLFQQMTEEEIAKIAKLNGYDELWCDMWNSPDKTGHEHEYEQAKRKYDQLVEDDEILSLEYYIKHVKPVYDSPEWGFPKGRRNFRESDLQCAKREFSEETGLSEDSIHILESIPPVSEDFYGTNNIRYRHVYYLAFSPQETQVKLDPTNPHQAGEIGDIGWFSFVESTQLIRPYQTERKRILTLVYMALQQRLITALNEHEE